MKKIVTSSELKLKVSETLSVLIDHALKKFCK